ncbi:MAG: hypothetical protein WA160_08820 [Pseudobdellovibrio sp.]
MGFLFSKISIGRIYLKFEFCLLLIVAIIFFSIDIFFIKPAAIKRSEYLVPPNIIKNMGMGMSIQTADSFWLRSIQDFDYCDHPLNDKECKAKSWLYEVLNLTTDLDSKFYDAYYYGGLALSVIISDFQGATKIFDKGILEFPQKWQLNYVAGYHAMFEEKNITKAATLFYTAAANGAPGWLNVLAGRLAVDAGNRDFAVQILTEIINNSEDPKLVERLKIKISEISK